MLKIYKTKKALDILYDWHCSIPILKIAKVIPVFKKGDPNCIENYRPISILSCFSKIFEKCVYARTIKFLDKYNILTKSQFGFRSKHSTTHALLDFIDKVSNAIDDSKHTIGIFIDLSIRHLILSTIKYYCINSHFMVSEEFLLSGLGAIFPIDHSTVPLMV